MRDPSADYRTALAHELRPLTRRIIQALAERAEPEGREAYPFEVEMLAEGLPDALLPALETLSTALPGLLGERSWLPPNEAAREAVTDVESAVASLLETLQSVWERPFPCGQEDGQHLLSVYVERPLKVVLAALAWLVGRIEDEEVGPSARPGPSPWPTRPAPCSRRSARRPDRPRMAEFVATGGIL